LSVRSVRVKRCEYYREICFEARKQNFPVIFAGQK
jgi:hypothetical protein